MVTLFKIGQQTATQTPLQTPTPNLEGLEPQKQQRPSLQAIGVKLHEVVEMMDQLIEVEPNAIVQMQPLPTIRNYFAGVAQQMERRPVQMYQRQDKEGRPISEKDWSEMQRAGGDGTGKGPYWAKR